MSPEPTQSGGRTEGEMHPLEVTAAASFPNIPGIRTILLDAHDRGASHGIGAATILSLVRRCEQAEHALADTPSPAPVSSPVQGGRPDTAKLRPCGCGRPIWTAAAEEERDADGSDEPAGYWCPHWCIEDVVVTALAPGDLYAVEGDAPLEVRWREVIGVGALDGLVPVFHVKPGHPHNPIQARSVHCHPDHEMPVLRYGMIGRQTVRPATPPVVSPEERRELDTGKLHAQAVDRSMRWLSQITHRIADGGGTADVLDLIEEQLDSVDALGVDPEEDAVLYAAKAAARAEGRPS